MTTADLLREEGRKEASERTQRENLLLLLSRRFGPQPEPILTHIRQASLAQLRQWFERGITASSLEAVFAGE